MSPVPFNRPCLTGREYAYIEEALRNMHISGDGAFTKKCHALLEEAVGGKALLTTSCTSALEMAALLLECRMDDEIIIPSFTFVSSANAFVLHGARPVFIDCRPDTLNLDENQIEALITPRTRALVVVHYAGVGCEMDAITGIAKKHGLRVIEDNAHGLFGAYRGRPLGSFGDLATLSFHETKNFICGEGGALIVNEPAWHDRSEILREKGTNRRQFFRGMVDKYTWVDVGSSYLPSDLLAAFLLAQLEERETVLRKRGAIWRRYHENLSDWANEIGAQLPIVPEHCQSSFHMFHLVLPDGSTRDGLIRHLADREIGSVFHYVPLHLSGMGRRFGGREGQCPVTESVSDRLVRLPFYNDLALEEVDRVCEAVREYRR